MNASNIELKIGDATIRRLAVRADCHPRTVTKALRGEFVRGMVGARIKRVLHEEGLQPSAGEPSMEERDGAE